MKKHTPELPLQIPLADFLKMNDHGLLDSCDEIKHWNLILNYIAYFLETDTIFTRGSCIAQVVIRELALETENTQDPNYCNIRHALTPYTSETKYLIDYCSDELTSDDEKSFIERICESTNMKNIDIYVQLDSIDAVNYFAKAFEESFPNSDLVNVSNLEFLPNGIAKLKIDVKGGYVDHEVILALKPPLEQDLRKDMSSRQDSSKAKVVKKDNGWVVEINQQDVEAIISQDKFEFLNKDLQLPELLIQTSRAMRFNSIYKVNNKDLNISNELKKAAKQISLKFESLDSLDTDNFDYLLNQSMNEFMLSFLYDPTAFINFINLLPIEMFPYINREFLNKNKQVIINLLSNTPKHHFRYPQSDLNLSEVASLLVGDKPDSLKRSKVNNDYGAVINSINEKTGFSEAVESEDTHTTWIFREATDYFLFQLMFYPVKLK